jgi:hypothetical protein
LKEKQMNKLAILGVVSALALSAPAFAQAATPAAAKAAVTKTAATKATAAKTAATKKATETSKVTVAIAALKKAQKDLMGNTDEHAVKALDLVNNAISELQPAAK